MSKAGKKLNLFVYKALALLMVCSFGNGAKSQQSHTLFFMHSLPQANYTNPAVQIPCKVFVGMPLLSSVHVNYSNTWFSFNDIAYPAPNGGTFIKPAFFLTAPGSRQQIFAELHFSILHAGFRYKNYYFNFSIQDKIDVGISFPSNVFHLLLEGNEKYIGQNMEFNGIAVFGQYYREWAFGISKILSNSLTFGAKAKLLFGKANISTSQSNISLNTATSTHYLDLALKMQVNASPLALDISNNQLNSVALPDNATIAQLLLNSKNKGVAFDFGTIWKIDQKFTLSASLLDIGFIRYSYSPVGIDGSGVFQFRGLSGNTQSTPDEVAQQIQDDIRNSYSFNVTEAPYYAFLSPKLYSGVTYSILPSLNSGLMFRNELYNGKLLSSATASVNAFFRNYLTGSVSWSYINGSILNFGAGIGLRSPNFGLYVISDNVYGAFKYKSARLLNARFGLNFLFGCRQSVGSDLSLIKKGCAVYRKSYEREQKFANWLERMKKAKKERQK